MVKVSFSITIRIRRERKHGGVRVKLFLALNVPLHVLQLRLLLFRTFISNSVIHSLGTDCCYKNLALSGCLN